MKKTDILDALDTWYVQKEEELGNTWNPSYNVYVYVECKEFLDGAKNGLENSDSPWEFMNFLISHYTDDIRYSAADEFLEILTDLLLRDAKWEDAMTSLSTWKKEEE